MKETLEKAISSILFNKLIDYFDDIESLTLIQTTTDFKLIMEIQELIDKLDYNDKTRNIDYDLVFGAWNKIRSSIKELNKEHADLIENIKTLFEFNIQDDFLMSGTLFNHEKKIITKLSEELKNTYKIYIKKLNNIILEFRIDLLTYSIANTQDEFFTQQNIIDESNIKYTQSNFDKKSVYLDTNVIQIYANDTRLINLVNEYNIGFVYSSYTIEDLINSNPIFISSSISDLMKITEGNMVGYADDGLTFVKENIYDTRKRVEKYNHLTKLYEQTILTNIFTHYHLYPELRKGQELYNKSKNNLIEFLTNIEKNKILGWNKVELKFNSLLNNGLVENGTLSKIENYQDTITELSEFFDFINYETEDIKYKNKSKIVSAYRDRMHLEHAYICDYFITNDSKLLKRAKAIFYMIGSNTQVYSSNEFKQVMQNLSTNPTTPSLEPNKGGTNQAETKIATD